MSLILQREIADATQLGIWRIEEDTEWFRKQLILDEKEKELINSIKNPRRKIHWLSSRVLIRTLMQTSEFIHLESNEFGKPLIRNFPVHLSLSHSQDLSALVLSGKFEVGIDIEKIDPKIFRIEHKFISDAEMHYLDEDHKLEQLYIIWCVKEALYKLYGLKQLNFRDHLFVEPFHYSDRGETVGVIRKNGYKEQLNVSYERLNGYMVAYVVR